MKKPENYRLSHWQPQQDHPLFALYGSLRSGMENRFRISGAAETMALTSIAGFSMFLKGDYPYVVASENPYDRIIVELVRITEPKIVRHMCDFEQAEGYLPELVQVGAYTAWLFLFSDPGDDPRIHGGDWAAYLQA